MFKSLFSRGPAVENLGGGEFAREIKAEKKAVVLDVRTAGEYRSGHLPKSKNIDVMSMSFKSKIADLDKSKTYFVYCRSGARSGRACKMMMKEGFEQVYNLAGGIGAWPGKVVR